MTETSYETVDTVTLPYPWKSKTFSVGDIVHPSSNPKQHAKIIELRLHEHPFDHRDGLEYIAVIRHKDGSLQKVHPSWLLPGDYYANENLRKGGEQLRAYNDALDYFANL